jgi:hypothetical protein
MRRVTIATILAVPALALAGVAAAQAHEFTPSWGYGFIDDNPFNEPPANGALLPSTQAYPRGFIRDTVVDGRDVRLTVFAFTPGNSSAAASYKVEEGDFQNVSIDRRLDISPFQLSYLRYDFCRFNPSNGAVDACDTIHRIGRPSATPTPTPIPAPTPGGGTPPPTDADGDGVPASADCWDQNATVFPGGKEIAGNGIDDDCAGGDAPARLTATVRSKWTIIRGRLRVDEMRVLDAPEGATVEVRCRGRRCPFTRRSTTANAKGQAHLRKLFTRRLRPRITIDIRITYPNTIGKVVRFPIKLAAVPDLQRFCIPPGAAKPGRC